jgi:hypothetical protein
MIYIAHRGNLNGPDSKNENKPEYLLEAISKGFYVETDLWIIDNVLYLGHDKPDYKIEVTFLLNIKEKLFCHCKNIEALHFLIENLPEIECFFHNEDECTLTSKNHIWNYPGKKLTSSTICVMPEYVNQEIDERCFGICSDFVNNIKKTGTYKIF